MNVRKLMTFVQLGGLAAPHAMNLMDPNKDGRAKLKEEIYMISGYDTGTGKWHWEGLAKGWLPGIATVGATEVYLNAKKIVKGLVKFFT